MKSFAAALFIAEVLAHSGVSRIRIDGTDYPPWDVRIDAALGDVRRIQWSYTPAKSLVNPISAQFGPVNNISSPAIACGPNAKQPVLKAVARAGAEVNVKWSKIIRMHRGPILTWMGVLPTPDTPATQVKFFKIDEPSYDAATDTWANERAAENGMSHSFRIPSDIKPGTYVLRTELLALHGNTPSMQPTPVSGPEFYLHCFNVEVTGSGTATPPGNTFPGTYVRGDPGLSFAPHYGAGSAVQHNSRYVTPGPAVYKGKHDPPTGPAPVVKETGAYTGALRVKYDELKDKLDLYGGKIIDFVNTAWPANKEYKDVGTAYMKIQMSSEMRNAYKTYEGLKTDIEAFKAELQKQ